MIGSRLCLFSSSPQKIKAFEMKWFQLNPALFGWSYCVHYFCLQNIIFIIWSDSFIISFLFCETKLVVGFIPVFCSSSISAVNYWHFCNIVDLLGSFIHGTLHILHKSEMKIHMRCGYITSSLIILEFLVPQILQFCLLYTQKGSALNLKKNFLFVLRLLNQYQLSDWKFHSMPDSHSHFRLQPMCMLYLIRMHSTLLKRLHAVKFVDQFSWGPRMRIDFLRITLTISLTTVIFPWVWRERRDPVFLTFATDPVVWNFLINSRTKDFNLNENQQCCPHKYYGRNSIGKIWNNKEMMPNSESSKLPQSSIKIPQNMLVSLHYKFISHFNAT